MSAARVWWMLRAFGFDDPVVLDGGWRACTAQGRPVCTEPCAYAPAQFVAKPRPGLFVGVQDVLGAIEASGCAEMDMGVDCGAATLVAPPVSWRACRPRR